MKKRTLMVLVALVLVFGIAVGGTLALLTSKSAEVTNTFTVGDINIKLDESKLKEDGTLDTSNRVQQNTYKTVPGKTYPKDPTVTVLNGSEACYLFVKVTETNNTITGLDGKVVSYTVDSSWTQYPGTTDVWYRTVPAATADTPFQVLTNDQVTVNSKLTKAMVQTFNENKPAINFIAVAVQQDSVTLAEAYAEASAQWTPANP